MPPLTLLDLTNFARELAASAAILADVHTLPLRERAGAAYGRALAHVPYSALRALERLHAPLASWALVGLALAGRGRSVPPAALVLLALLAGGAGACADATQLVEPEAPACMDALPEPHVFLTLAASECEGWSVDGSDTTSFRAHPDTGVCTLPCEGDRSLPYYCAALGGCCTLASDGSSYCEAAQ